MENEIDISKIISFLKEVLGRVTLSASDPNFEELTKLIIDSNKYLDSIYKVALDDNQEMN